MSDSPERYLPEKLSLPESVLRRQYVGVPLDSEIKSLVKKWIRVSKELEMLVDQVVQDADTEYVTFDDFTRQAIWDQLNRLIEGGSLSEQAGGELEHIRLGRERAHYARRRAEIREMLKAFDDELNTTRRAGDWKHVAGELKWIEDWMSAAPTESIARTYRQVAVQNLAIQKAVKWLAEVKAASSEAVEVAERWGVMFEEWIESA